MHFVGLKMHFCGQIAIASKNQGKENMHYACREFL
jgi:hypothetical protein